MDGNEKQQFLFTQLILMFHTATMHQLGKIQSPVTGKIERDLEAAQNSIDILDMLQEKTKGNLGENEQRLLSTVLQELKLNFVDEANKKPEAESHTPPPADASQSPEGQKPQGSSPSLGTRTHPDCARQCRPWLSGLNVPGRNTWSTGRLWSFSGLPLPPGNGMPVTPISALKRPTC